MYLYVSSPKQRKMYDWVLPMLLFLFSIVIGIIGYFLKRRDDSIDTIANDGKNQHKEVLEAVSSIKNKIQEVSTSIYKLQLDIGGLGKDIKILEKRANLHDEHINKLNSEVEKLKVLIKSSLKDGDT